VTGDPAELAAGQRAAARSYEEFPYYAARFRERGMRFGISDSGWLLTLCDLSRTRALEQIDWLASVLAARGMPRLLLERHLEILREELPTPRCAMLTTAARHLRAKRLRYIDEETARNLAATFAEPLPNLGALLVAAVSDEADGVAHAVESILRWIDETYDADVQGGARALIEEARNAARA